MSEEIVETTGEETEFVMTSEKEKALLELLKFKTIHRSAITRTLGKYDKSAGEDADKSLQKLIDRMMKMGYSRELLEQKVYMYWRYAEAIYEGRKVKEVL